MGVDCPCCGFSAESAKAELPFSSYRGWWAAHVVGRPFRKTWKRLVTPEPGTVDLLDEELG